MTMLRPAELAGTWYPGSASACDRFLDEVAPFDGSAAVDGAAPELPAKLVGAIVPHAGWVYSGAVAFQAMRLVAQDRTGADLVIIFGGHLGPRDRPRIFIEGGFSTPYGPLPIATGLAQDLSMAVESELETPEEYFDDNAIEVLMPQIKRLWPGAQVITLGVPPIAAAPDMGIEAALLAKRRGFERIVVIGSTDLTHYGPNYDYRPHGEGRRGLDWVKTKNDPEVIEHIEALDGAKVLWVAQRSRNACCPGAVAACLAAARKLGATRGRTTQYTTSFDVRPREDEPSSFVGYAGIVLGRGDA